MPFSNYKIWQLGTPVGEGVTGAMYVGVSAVAKCESENYPYLVENEIICAHLARGLLLPIPPGFALKESDKRYFASLDFSLAGECLPPANAKDLVEQHPQKASDIVAFDIWVMNHDRHAKNISFDKSSNKIQVFDHSHALLADAKNIPEWLNQNKDKICIGSHCLAPHLNDEKLLLESVDRIGQIADFYIQGVICSDPDSNLGRMDAVLLEKHLLDRRDRLQEIILNHKAMFPKVSFTSSGDTSSNQEKQQLATTNALAGNSEIGEKS